MAPRPPFARWPPGNPGSISSSRTPLVAVIAFILVATAGEANAQPIDEAWVVTRIVAGQFDELRRVQAESGKGAPEAMYWWGVFLETCVFDGCDPKGARTLWVKAAKAGHSRAKVTLMSAIPSRRELDELIRVIGAPVTLEEKVGYAGALVAVSQPGAPEAWGEARAVLRELARTYRRLIVLYTLGVIEGFTGMREELRAMVEAGFSRASEDFQRLLVLQGRGEYPQVLARAQAGDVAAGVSLCDTVGVTHGYQVLPPALLPICERALMQGYLGIARVLLRHHHENGHAKAAAFYAQLCTTRTVSCASELADYHHDRSGESAAWELWDAVAGIDAGVPWHETNKPATLLRQVLSIRVRRAVAERACGGRRFDPVSRKFADDPACPYGKPIAIPAEFLGSGKPSGG